MPDFRNLQGEEGRERLELTVDSRNVTKKKKEKDFSRHDRVIRGRGRRHSNQSAPPMLEKKEEDELTGQTGTGLPGTNPKERRG